MWRDLISGKLSELEVRKQYQIEITKWFAPLENLNDSEDMNRAWENIKENIKMSAKESLCLCISHDFMKNVYNF